jgi:hypothetical protein
MARCLVKSSSFARPEKKLEKENPEKDYFESMKGKPKGLGLEVC